MAVKVKITQKGIMKKQIELQQLIPSRYGYGILNDQYVLQENQISKYVIVYNPVSIARGIEISLDENDRNSVWLSLSLPTAIEEIKGFYSIVKSICEKLHTTYFTRDEKQGGFSDFDWMIQSDKEASEEALNDMFDKIGTEYVHYYIFGALNPICIGEAEKEKLKFCGLNGFGEYLNNIQKVDAYYTAPNFYQKKDGTIFGCYAICADITSIVPLKPKDIMGRMKEVNEWYVLLSDKTVPYQAFIDSIIDKEYYDDENVLIRGISQTDLSLIIEKHEVKI